MFEKISSMEKINGWEGGVTSFRRKLFVPNRRKTTWANPSVFQKGSGIKFFCVVRVSRFCWSFLSHSTEKLRRGPLCFGNVLVLNNFWIIRYHYFVDFFCLTSPEIILGETFCVSELLRYQNQSFLDKKGITNLPIVFVSQSQKFCGEPSNDSKKLGHPRFYA